MSDNFIGQGTLSHFGFNSVGIPGPMGPAGQQGPQGVAGSANISNATVDYVLIATSAIAATSADQVSSAQTWDTDSNQVINIAPSSSKTINIGNSTSTTNFAGTVNGVGGTISGLTPGIVPVAYISSTLEDSISSASARLDSAAAGTINVANVNATTAQLGNSSCALTISASTGPIIPSATASTAAVFDSSKRLISSSTTATELGYVHNVTSAIQTQFNSLTNSAGLTANQFVVASGSTSMISIPNMTFSSNTFNISGSETSVGGEVVISGGGATTSGTNNLILYAGESTFAADNVTSISAGYPLGGAAGGTVTITGGRAATAANNAVYIQGGVGTTAGNIFIGNANDTTVLAGNGITIGCTASGGGTTTIFGSNTTTLADNQLILVGGDGSKPGEIFMSGSGSGNNAGTVAITGSQGTTAGTVTISGGYAANSGPGTTTIYGGASATASSNVTNISGGSGVGGVVNIGQGADGINIGTTTPTGVINITSANTANSGFTSGAVNISATASGSVLYFESGYTGTGSFAGVTFNCAANVTSGSTSFLINTGGSGANSEIWTKGDNAAAGGNVTNTGWFNNSDARLKKDIIPHEGGLKFINKIKVREFKWRDTNKTEIGFIAQEMQEIGYPAVGESHNVVDGEKMLCMSTKPLWGPTIRAIQEQNELILAQGKRIEILEAALGIHRATPASDASYGLVETPKADPTTEMDVVSDPEISGDDEW